MITLTNDGPVPWSVGVPVGFSQLTHIRVSEAYMCSKLGHYYTTRQQSFWGLLVSLCLFVRPSVHPSVHPASCVQSVAPSVLVGSISYLCILLSNFRSCVMSNISCKILRFEFLEVFLKSVTLTWYLMWITNMCNHGVAGVSWKAGILVILVGSDNGLSPVWYLAIISSNTG